MGTLSPSGQWADLKAEMLRRIAEIDDATPWQSVEPEWWLQMSMIARLIRTQP